MRPKSSALLLAMASLALTGPLIPGELPRIKGQPEPKAKLPFTDEEKEKLATLSGKEKKAYVKELKEKYLMTLRGMQK